MAAVAPAKKTGHIFALVEDDDPEQCRAYLVEDSHLGSIKYLEGEPLWMTVWENAFLGTDKHPVGRVGHAIQEIEDAAATKELGFTHAHIRDLVRHREWHAKFGSTQE